MIKDYKHLTNRNEPRQQMTGKVRGFLFGISLGLVFTGAVHIYHITQKPAAEDFNPPKSSTSSDKSNESSSAEPSEPKLGIGSQLHRTLVNEANIDAPTVSVQYLLQAGSYRTSEEAEARKARILALGYKSQLREIKTDDEILYLVELGPYHQFEAAQATLAVLKRNRIEVLLKQYSE